MQLNFTTLVEDQPSAAWLAHFQRLWPVYEQWYLSEGLAARPTYLACRRALLEHMPEIVPLWEKLCELAGGGDLAARFLSFWQPPVYISACSQAVYLHDNVPLIVRNYDYNANHYDGLVMDTNWLGKHRVCGSSDGLWGLLDGMNGSGLALSLTFGGSRAVGSGFGIPLILRYVLETCTTTDEAVAALQRIPCHMAYNITLVDAQHNIATVLLAPDTPARIRDVAVATNHQDDVEMPIFAQATATVEREQFLLGQLNSAQPCTQTEFINHFLRPPLYSVQFARGFGTLYTAAYWPTLGQYAMYWPGVAWPHALGQTVMGDSRLITYPV